MPAAIVVNFIWIIFVSNLWLSNYWVDLSRGRALFVHIWRFECTFRARNIRHRRNNEMAGSISRTYIMETNETPLTFTFTEKYECVMWLRSLSYIHIILYIRVDLIRWLNNVESRVWVYVYWFFLFLFFSFVCGKMLKYVFANV